MDPIRSDLKTRTEEFYAEMKRAERLSNLYPGEPSPLRRPSGPEDPSSLAFNRQLATDLGFKLAHLEGVLAAAGINYRWNGLRIAELSLPGFFTTDRGEDLEIAEAMIDGLVDSGKNGEIAEMLTEEIRLEREARKSGIHYRKRADLLQADSASALAAMALDLFASGTQADGSVSFARTQIEEFCRLVFRIERAGLLCVAAGREFMSVGDRRRSEFVEAIAQRIEERQIDKPQNGGE